MDQPFLERDAPLTELEGLVRTAASGAGHTVFVTGDAGAGKTTLLRAFEARAGDARVLHGACEDLSIPEPLGALRDLAQAAGTDLDALVRDEADRLAVFRRVLSLVTTSNSATEARRPCHGGSIKQPKLSQNLSRLSRSFPVALHSEDTRRLHTCPNS